MNPLAENLRRLMATAKLTIGELATSSRLSVRTIQGILSGATPRPHATTLHALARGLDVSVDALLCAPSARRMRSAFDRATNPLVSQVIAERPQLFRGWTPDEFDELFSRFGAGGALTYDGTIAAAEQMNHKRQQLRRAALVLESEQAEVLAAVIDALYSRVVVVARTAASSVEGAASAESATPAHLENPIRAPTSSPLSAS